MTQDELHALADRFVAELRAGESPSWEELATAHPHLGADIRRLFPILLAMEDAKARVAPAPEPVSEGLPAVIGPWRILRELGRGGMGAVYEGRDARARRAAIKIVHPHLAAQEPYRARFLRERGLQTRIEHPNVIRSYEYGIANLDGVDVPYVAMEYVAGQTLRDLVDEVGALPERLVRHVGACIAQALEACHQAGVVHRDVKPTNVAITGDETVKLLDFGVALGLDDEVRLSRTGDFVGSLLYAAPEQFSRKPVDATADLYSLGVVLYELVTGEHPTGESISVASIAAGLDEAVRSPARRMNRVSPVLDALVWQLLSPDPTQRPSSAREVAEVLRLGSRSTWWTDRRRGHSADVLAWRPRGRHQLPLTGRDAPLAQLDDALAQIRSGKGRVVLVEGSGGMGKSRLLEAWLNRLEHDPHPPAVLFAEHPPDGSLGASPLADALRARLRPSEYEAHVRKVMPQAKTLAGILVEQLRGEPTPPSQPQHPTPSESADTALVRYLAGLAETRPVLVVVEDLHFASSRGRAQFVTLSHAAAAHQILVIGTLRSEPTATWARALLDYPHVEHLILDGLEPEDARALYRAAALANGSSTGIEDERLDAMAGHPFLILGLAAGTRSSIEDVASVVRDELAGLDADQRALVDMASCVGYRFESSAVAHAMGSSHLRVLRMLLTIERGSGLIQSDGAQYRFRHHVVHDTVYRDQSAQQRRERHAALARSFANEAYGIAPVDLCRHALVSETPALAQPHLVEAFQHLVATERHGDATRLAQLAESCASVFDPRTQGWIHWCLGWCGMNTEPLADCQAALDRAKRAGSEAEDGDLLYRVSLASSIVQQLLGRIPEAIAYGERALMLAGLHGTPVDEVNARVALSQRMSRVGRHVDARSLAEEAVHLAVQEGLEGVESHAVRALGTLDLQSGDLPRAQRHFQRAITLAERLGEPRQALNALTSLSVAYYHAGDFERAHETSEEVAQRAQALGDLQHVTIVRTNMARLYMLRGRFEGALKEAQRAEEVIGSRDWPENRAYARLSQAIALEALGRPQEAWRLGEPILAVAARHQDSILIVGAESFRMRLLVWKGHFDEADIAYARAMSVAQEEESPEFILSLLAQRCEMLHVSGRGDAIDAVVAQMRESLRDEVRGLHRFELHHWSGRVALHNLRPDAALACFNAAEDEALRQGFDGLRADIRVLRCRLPEGDPLQARATLEQHGHQLPWSRHCMAWHRLAEATGSPEDLQRSRDIARAYLADLTQEERDHAIAHVPLLRNLGE